MLLFCSQGTEVNYYEQMCLDWTRIYTPWNSAWAKTTQYGRYICSFWWTLKGIHGSPSQSVDLHAPRAWFSCCQSLLRRISPEEPTSHIVTLPHSYGDCDWLALLLTGQANEARIMASYLPHLEKLMLFSITVRLSHSLWNTWTDNNKYVDSLAQAQCFPYKP